MKPDQAAAGRQSQGRLWSTLETVYGLLHIPAAPSAADETTLFQHLQVKAGQRVFRIGQSFDIVYVVNSGFLKTVTVDECGNEQVLGFPMKGDLLGLDAIDAGAYPSEAAALSDCDLVLLPFRQLASLSRQDERVQHAIFRTMSRAMVQRQHVIGLIGSLPAEARVARFLVALADRFDQMGYSGTTFNLRMTRQEIGSYLGLTLETVSRTLSAFHEIGLITVHQRTVCINDMVALATLRRLPPSQARARSAMEKRAAWLGVAGLSRDRHRGNS